VRASALGPSLPIQVRLLDTPKENDCVLCRHRQFRMQSVLVSVHQSHESVHWLAGALSVTPVIQNGLATPSCRDGLGCG